MLNTTPTGFSKEPRPVYAPELNLLGFDKYWQYDNQTDLPYMWAEANRYWYRGRLVAALQGGNIYQAPLIRLSYVCKEWRETPNGKSVEKTVCENPDNGETFTDKKGNVFILDLPETEGKLRTVDINVMVEENREILGWLEDTTSRKILDIYEKYADKLDIFHVAFSGGKDSCVLLSLVKSVLPLDSFVVIFGDTGMEFPDTYNLVDQIEEQCKVDGIKFFRASSHLSPTESWNLFGPPSRVLRWCCYVHKSAPQILKLREVLGKQNYTGLAYVGVRAMESATRSNYEYENYGKKQKGQFSHNSILEWTSAEIWLYIYTHNLIINEAYKKGSNRIGCLCCPMGSGKSAYVELKNFKDDISMYHELIAKSNGRKSISGEDFIAKGGWNARRNGRDLSGNPLCYSERVENDRVIIESKQLSSSWFEWEKTLSVEEQSFLSYKQNGNGFIVTFPEFLQKEKPLYSRMIKQVAHKAAYCIGCKVCQSNCMGDSILFSKGTVKINNCSQCKKCHKVDSGCLVYHSKRHPIGGNITMSLNTMSNHAPRTEWLKNLFEQGNDFFIKHSLGSQQISFFKRFLKNADLADKEKLLPFADVVIKIGWDTNVAMGLILTNLVYGNPTFEWYVKNLDIGRIYDRNTVVKMLTEFDVDPPVAGSIVGAFGRLTETPLGTKLKFGHATIIKKSESKSEVVDITRTKCSVSDPRVILYALYKFAEKCNPDRDKKLKKLEQGPTDPHEDDYKEFTLTTLLNDSIERDGISPTRIFGLDREAMTPVLIGLSTRYPYFISASFANNLDKISLMRDKASSDVLKLFEEGYDDGQ